MRSCVYVLHKTCHKEISRPSRAVTAKKCTKKLFFGYKTYYFVGILVAVAVALLKLPHGDVTPSV